MSYELTMKRDASVTAFAGTNKQNHPCVNIVVDGEFVHTFPATSRVSLALKTASIREIERKLNGGNFFFVGDNLHDFRDSSYQGIVHDDSNIASMNELIGVTELSSEKDIRVFTNTQSPVKLGSTHSNHEFHVDGLGDGGNFNFDLMYEWSPFSNSIHSAFMLLRLVCMNGMSGARSAFNSKIPIINRWQEHLQIADDLLQIKIKDKLSKRLNQMTTEHSSVAMLNLISRHIEDRASSNFDKVSTLKTMNDIVNPSVNLRDTYKQDVMDDSRISAQLKGHLSSFDLFNITTELRTHYHSTELSTDAALDKITNTLVARRNNSFINFSNNRGSTPTSAFSDPETAFFGSIR